MTVPSIVALSLADGFIRRPNLSTNTGASGLTTTAVVDDRSTEQCRRMADYGRAHQLRREVMKPNAWGKPCPRCGRVMLPEHALDLDHGDDFASTGYLGMVHAGCNRRAGGHKGRARLVAKIREARRPRVFERVALGVEISEGRDHASIGAAGTVADGDPRVMLQLVEYLDDVTSVVAAVLRHVEVLAAVAVVIDPHSQAATLLLPLEKAKLRCLAKPSTSEVVAAHGRFLDELRAGRLRHVSHPKLDDAARAGTQRALAGAQTWDRRTKVDVSPLTAVTLALWGLETARPAPAPLAVS